MTAYVRFGPRDPDEEPGHPKTRFEVVCDTICWIVFIACCTYYCTRPTP